jgi:uncharacterized protein YkwD
MSHPRLAVRLPVRQAVLTIALVVALLAVVATVLSAPSGFAGRTTAAAAATAPAAVAVPENVQAGATNAYARTAFRATNTRRANHDRATLRGNQCLRRAALRQARAMANRGQLFHQDMGRVLRDCDLSGVGENVAYGYPTGRAVVQGWMDSPGHRANILRPQYRLMGLAAVKRDGRWWAAQVFGAR